MLRMAQTRLGESVQETATQGDIRILPFQDNVFDKTLCFGAFPPLPVLKDVENAIYEFVRITKPNGKVFFTYNPPHVLRYISVRYWRIKAKLFTPSLRNLPFIDGRTDGTNSHNDILTFTKSLNMPFIHSRAGTGIFGTICINVQK